MKQFKLCSCAVMIICIASALHIFSVSLYFCFIDQIVLFSHFTFVCFLCLFSRLPHSVIFRTYVCASFMYLHLYLILGEVHEFLFVSLYLSGPLCLFLLLRQILVIFCFSLPLLLPVPWQFLPDIPLYLSQPLPKDKPNNQLLSIPL